jgi:hypothetical protein
MTSVIHIKVLRRSKVVSNIILEEVCGYLGHHSSSEVGKNILREVVYTNKDVPCSQS